MADYELIGLNEAAPDLRAPTSADRGIIAGGVRVVGLAELDGGADINGFPLGPTAINPLRQAVRVAMTAAASGSNGIQVASSTAYDLGTSNFTLHWEGALPDWTPAAIVRLIGKYNTINERWSLHLSTNGTLSVIVVRAGVAVFNILSTVATGLVDGSYAKISAVVTRETAISAGSVVFYVNGVQLGTSVSITAAATLSASNTGALIVCGDPSTAARHASDTQDNIIYNRALTAPEVLSLCVNGPALADLGASQVPLKTFDFSAGTDTFVGFNGTVAGNIDSIGGVDNTLRLTATSADNVRASLPLTAFTARTRSRFRVYMPASNVTAKGVQLRSTSAATSTTINSTVLTPDTWTEIIVPDAVSLADQNGWAPYMMTAAGLSTGITSGDLMYIESGGTVTRLGITGQWSAEDAQSNTGQIFDSSGNKNHALLPAAGATIIGKPVSGIRQVRWTNTWAGTNELQYIGGVNQAILPANAYIDSIVGTVSGATPHDIIVGDGTDADRYVTITTGLATGTATFTLANRTTDGTNLKLTVDPDTNCTMSIAWVISYRILE